MVSQQDRVVALHMAGREKWREARLEIQAQIPDIELANGPWTEVVCVAVLTERATNSRTVVRLRPWSGSWGGTAVVPRGAFRARLDLTLSVVATVGGVAGRVVATAQDSWLVDLTARVPVRQRELDINEMDFRDGPHEWLRPFRDAPWLVETSGDMPTIHLNTGFEGVTELLGAGSDPTERAVGRLLATQIATDAWTAMFHSAVSDLEVDGDGVPQWPSGWRDWVLRSMLPDILPELSPADGLLEIHGRRSESSGWHELQPLIQYAASRRAHIAKNLGTVIRVLGRSGRESTG
ncbi:hypothetical protein ACFFT8_22585 [Streptomyces purpureus]